MLLGHELARGGVLRVLLLARLAVLRRRVLELLGGSAERGLLHVLAAGELGAVGVVGGGGRGVGTDGDVLRAGLGEFLLLREAAGVGVALAEAADEGDGEEDGHGGEDGNKGAGEEEVVTGSRDADGVKVVHGLCDEFKEGLEEEGRHHDDDHEEGSLGWC